MEWKNPDGSLTGGVVIEDGAGNKLGTPANPLNVTGVAGGGGGGSNASVGVAGSSIPADATAIGYQNASGNLAIPSSSAGLPIADTGAAATGVAQPAGGSGLSGWLSGIYARLAGTLSVSWSGQSVAVSSLPSLPSGANAIGSVSISNLPATQTISAASLPLPNGAALEAGGNLASVAANVSTAANQLVVSATLSSILTKLGSVVLSAGASTIGSVGVNNKPVGAGSIATSQASIGTSASQIVAARTGAVGAGRVSVTLYNAGSTTTYIGPSGVTASTGQILPAGAAVTLDVTATIYGVASSGTNTIGVTETF